MPKFTVRMTGTSPVWADIEVEAEDPEDAQEKAGDTDPRFTAAWQLSEGNGVNDWEVDVVMDANGKEVPSEDD